MPVSAELTLANKPFHPRSEETINPYDLVRTDSFSAPPIGLDGGILIPGYIVEQEAQNPLGIYLQTRTLQIPSGAAYAVVHSEEGVRQWYRSTGETKLYTSRAASYYDANYTFSRIEDKTKREAILANNLQQDTALIEHWDDVIDLLQRYSPEDQWSTIVGLQQIIGNDLVGLEYAQTVAKRYRPDSYTTGVREETLAATTTYYQNLLCPGKASYDMSHFSILEQSLDVMARIHEATPGNVDNYRTARESDMTYLILAAGKTFLQQEGNQIDHVIIPLLGGWDWGPVLCALGYQGSINYILPTIKTGGIDYRHIRRETVPLGVAQDLHPSLYGSDSVGFLDDSVGSGRSALQMLADIWRQASIDPVVIRTLFIHDRDTELRGKTPSTQFFQRYGDRYEAYFTSPVMRGYEQKLQNGEQTLFQRSVTQRWIRQSSVPA